MFHQRANARRRPGPSRVHPSEVPRLLGRPRVFSGSHHVRGAIPMINEEAAERFMTAPWLAEVEREPKLALLNALDEQKAGAGTVLLSQGQPNDHLTFLIDGKVELERTFGNGRKEIVTTLTAPA